MLIGFIVLGFSVFLGMVVGGQAIAEVLDKRDRNSNS